MNVIRVLVGLLSIVVGVGMTYDPGYVRSINYKIMPGGAPPDDLNETATQIARGIGVLFFLVGVWLLYLGATAG